MGEACGQRLKDLERAAVTARVGYFKCDMTLGTYEASPELSRVYGLPINRVHDRDEILTAIHPEDRGRVAGILSHTVKQPRDYAVEYRLPGADGVCRHMRVVADVSVDAAGHVQAFGTVQDVTAIREAESVARSSERRLRDFAASASDWFWETDSDHRFVYVSNRIEETTGRPASSFIGRSRMEVGADALQSDGWPTHVADLAAKRPFKEFTYWLRASKRGEDRLVQIGGVPVFDDDGHFVGYRGVGRDVTDTFLREQEMLRLAKCDSLTGLMNRHAFVEAVSNKRAQAGPDTLHTALFLIDLDRFKFVNDNFGHAAGDRLLQVFARRLQQTVTQNAEIARLAGDEFAIAIDLEETSRPTEEELNARLRDLAGRIYASCAGQAKVDNAVVDLELNIGVLPELRGNLDQALLEADVALNAAKRSSSRIQIFDDAMRMASNRRKTLERALRQAAANNEFYLVFQPQYDLRSGRMIGVEALMRWRREDGQEISPGEFVPIAEDSGLMPEIGRWVLDHAIEQLGSWRREFGADITMAINVSPQQFSQDDVSGLTMAASERHDVPPTSIELEITESVFVQDEGRVADVMRRLRSQGIRLALDDFGTGYSSLSYLRAFPVDRLKIDRSFIMTIEQEDSARAIVEGIVRLAHTLSLEVLAEGVELDRHVEILRQLSCDAAQGYLFAKPLPAHEIAEMLAPKPVLVTGSKVSARA